LRPIRPGFHTFIGLNTATHRGDGLVGINPIIGLRDDAVENLLTELTGYPGIVTLSMSLGYLMPEQRYIEWVFSTANPATVQQLLDSIRTFGYVAVELLASREAVSQALKDRRMTDNQSRAYRLPIAYLLQGEKDSAIRELRCELDSISVRTDEAANHYRLFAQNLERRTLSGTL
jgi:hypothetical protein